MSDGGIFTAYVEYTDNEEMEQYNGVTDLTTEGGFIIIVDESGCTTILPAHRIKVASVSPGRD